MADGGEIKSFLESKMKTDNELGSILRSLRELVIERYPDAVEELKYGGICYFDAGLLVGGIFQSRKHVSFEFSEGGGHEGSGRTAGRDREVQTAPEDQDKGGHSGEEGR